MDLTSLPTIQKLCKQYHIVPNKERGQHFLIDRSVLATIVDAADLRPTDTVLEVGPGFGVLTQALAPHVHRVFAVELDRNLTQALYAATKEFGNVEIIHDDIFRWVEMQSDGKRHPERSREISSLGLPRLPIGRARNDKLSQFHFNKIVANLPYQITGKFFRFFLEREPRPDMIVVMIQKEVAKRIVAKPGDMNMLALLVQYYTVPEIIAVVPKSCFWPEPAVDSAVVRLRPHPNKPHPETSPQPSPARRGGNWRGEGNNEAALLFRLAKIGFSSRRKQLQHNLSAGLKIPKKIVIEQLESVGLSPTVRAQELSVENWKKLLHIIHH